MSVDVLAGETAVPALGADEARALTDQIKTGIEEMWSLITRAYTERAWAALEYESWDDYCTREFATARLRLPREDRAEVVASMRESGMSLRAIGSATGISRPTIIKDVSSREVVNSLPPEDGASRSLKIPGDVTASTPGQTDRVAAALASAQAKRSEDSDTLDANPPKTTGMDGKEYPQTRPARKSPRRPLVEDAAKLTVEWRRFNGKLQKLLEDDRFGRSREGVMEALGPQPAITTELLARLDRSAPQLSTAGVA